MIVGVDAWSRYDEDADHLAHLVCEVVGGLAVGAPGGRGPLEALLVATHGVPAAVSGGEPHSAVSAVVPDGLGLPPPAVLEGLGAVVDAEVRRTGVASGAVVVTGTGLGDGLVRGDAPGAVAGAWVAVAASVTGASGRLVRYPGSDVLRGTLTVADVLARSWVDDVVVVGGAPSTPATLVDTRGFVRPRVEAGRVVLHVQPAVGGVMVPFEKERPERCCEDH
ncbi:hypothetical protein [Aquipuribacter sp. SD81]|uniref:hypothetical protein n=1 Tax=Aquipuribacter sp. SD81 TaxID=3127703 RepID=UPI00301739BF